MRAHKGPLLSSINLFYSFFLPLFLRTSSIKIPFSLTFVKISRQKEPARVRLCRKLKADTEGVINLLEYFRIQMAYLILQSPFVNSPKLLKENYRVFHDRIRRRIDLYMRRQLGFIHPGSNGRTDHCGTVFVSHVVLNDQNRPDTALLTAHYRAQVRIKNVTSFDNHRFHTPIFNRGKQQRLSPFCYDSAQFFCVYSCIIQGISILSPARL